MYIPGPAARAIPRRGDLRNLLHAIRRLPSRAIPLVSLVVLAFACGFLFGFNKWFPYATVEVAVKTATAVIVQQFPPFAPNQFIDFSGGSLQDIARDRIIVKASVPASANQERFLLSGGLYQFLDYCPGDGCIAAEFARNGALVHAYPFRPAQFETHQIVSLPYEQVGFRFAENMAPFGVLKLPDGDLIVSLLQWNSFPVTGGIARVHPDGSVAWFRHDYSHHWPRLLADGEIADPAMRIGPAQLSIPLPHNQKLDLACDGKTEQDIVRILDYAGKVKEEISVFDAFIASPYRGMLISAPDPCDPLHLNYVVPVSRSMMSLYPDVEADDLIVSLRNVSAFGILGRHDHKLKHLFTGDFVHQHSVQPLGQSASVLIFDNHGGDWRGGPSRLVIYDLADHRERTILPQADSGEIRLFSNWAGNISISHDLSRALVASTQEGRAYEIAIADGKVMTEFNNIHDLRKVRSAAEARDSSAARFQLWTIEYAQ